MIMILIQAILMFLAFRIYETDLLVNANTCNGYDVLTALVSSGFMDVVIFAVILLLCIQMKKYKGETEDHIFAFGASLLFSLGYLLDKTGFLARALQTKKAVLIFMIFFGGLFYLFRMCVVGIRLLGKKLQGKQFLLPEKVKNHVFLLSFLLLFVFYLPYALVRFPAGMEWDAQHQIEGFLLKNLTAHWPPASSALMGSFVAMGKGIFHSYSKGAFLYVLFQMTLSSAVFAYAIKILCKLGVKDIYCILALGVYAIVPVFPYYATTVMKDTPFSLSILLFVILIAEECLLEEKRGVKEFVFLLLTTVSMCLLRNNGIYIVYFCLVLSIYHSMVKKNKKYVHLMAVLLIAVGINMGYNKILLPALHIPGGSAAEALSVPFQQTARCVQMYPEEVSEKEKYDIDGVLDFQALAEIYNPLLSDPVKETYKGDNSKLIPYFATWAKMGLRHPVVYVESTLLNSIGFYYPGIDMETGESFWWYSGTENSNITIEYEQYRQLDVIKEGLNRFLIVTSRFPVGFIFFNTAMQAWILLYLVLHMMKKRKDLIMIYMPSIVSFLVCIASPTFTHNGARYAIPILFCNLFLLGVSIREKQQ